MQSEQVEFDLGESILQLFVKMGERGLILSTNTVTPEPAPHSQHRFIQPTPLI